MTRKRRAPQGTRDKRRLRDEQAMREARLARWRPFLKLGGPVLTIVLALPGVISLFPHLSVSPLASVREHEALGTIFDLNNGGLLTIHDVVARCTMLGPIVVNITFETPGSQLGDVEAGSSHSLPCDHAIRGLPDNAMKLSIDITYRPDWAFWHETKHFFFQSEKADSGVWVWRAEGK